MDWFSVCALQRRHDLLNELDVLVDGSCRQTSGGHLVDKGLDGDIVHAAEREITDSGENPLIQCSLNRDRVALPNRIALAFLAVLQPDFGLLAERGSSRIRLDRL